MTKTLAPTTTSATDSVFGGASSSSEPPQQMQTRKNLFGASSGEPVGGAASLSATAASSADSAEGFKPIPSLAPFGGGAPIQVISSGRTQRPAGPTPTQNTSGEEML